MLLVLLGWHQSIQKGLDKLAPDRALFVIIYVILNPSSAYHHSLVSYTKGKLFTYEKVCSKIALACGFLTVVMTSLILFNINMCRKGIPVNSPPLSCIQHSGQWYQVNQSFSNFICNIFGCFIVDMWNFCEISDCAKTSWPGEKLPQLSISTKGNIRYWNERILESAVIAPTACLFGFSPPAGLRNYDWPLESGGFRSLLLLSKWIQI